MSLYGPYTTLQRYIVTMLFAFVPSGARPPFASRLKTLLWASAAIAISIYPIHPQDIGLRGSFDEPNAPNTEFRLDTALSSEQDPPTLYGEDDFYDPQNIDTASDINGDIQRPVRPSTDADSSDANNVRLAPEAPNPLGDEGAARRENMPIRAEQGRNTTSENDPFVPVGIRAGNFILRPSLEQGIRATSNGDNSSSGSSAVLSESSLRLNAQSDWSRHQATLDASGTLSKSISGQDVSEPRLDIQGDLRLDISELTTIRAGAGYRLRRESASSPNGITDALKRPIMQTLDGSLGIEHDTGLVFGRATGRIQRNIYGDAELANGGTVSQKDRDNTYASILLRGGFALSPALRPFVEAELGKRMFDETIDSNGYERSGTQYALRGGLMFDRGEKFNGEIAAGYMRANNDDSRLSNISGPSLSALINWSPLRGTDMSLYAQTMVDTSTTPGVAGSLLHFASIDVSHRVRSDLSLNGRVDLTLRNNKDGSGNDYTIGAQIGATYWINRFMGLDARLRHEFQNSQIAEREYRSNSVYVGMKLQR